MSSIRGEPRGSGADPLSLIPKPNDALAQEELTPAQRRRSLAAVISSAAVAGLTFGLTIPLLSLLLERDGVGSTWIGLNAAVASLAILCVGPQVPRILEALGVLRAMYTAVAAGVVIILLLPAWYGLGPWFVLRFLLGAFGAVHWIVSETWIVSMTTPANRGRVISVYMTLLLGGFAAGPLLITLVGIDGWTPFLLSAGLIALSALPLRLAHACVPRIPPRVPAAFGTAFRAAPLVMAAAALGGFSDMGLFSLLPVYGIESGLERERAVLLLSCFMLGGVAMQVPTGWIADRVERRRLLIALGLLCLVCPVLLPAVLHHGPLLWPLLVLWGTASLGIYTIGLTLLGDRFGPGRLAGANAAFVAVYESGSLSGPITGGAGMDALGPNGLVVVFSAAAAVFLTVAALRRRRG